MSLFRFLGSLRFAIFLIAALALTLTFSTILESIYGTPFAQANFYAAHWFDFFLGLFWVNIFCATWTRYPFKKIHLGFIITHLGILTLLIGALLTRIAGAEGQMTVYENSAKNEIVRSGFALTVADPQGKKEAVNLKSKAGRLPASLPLKNKDIRLAVAEVLEHASETRYLIESDSSAPNPAIHLSLTSSLMGFDEKFTLIAMDPDNPRSSVRDIGPARFVLKKETAAAPAVTLVLEKSGTKTLPLDITRPLIFPISLENIGLEIVRLDYFPYAKISENKLVNALSETPFNPAVEFEIRDRAGHKEMHTKFLIFPDYPSIRGGVKADQFHLKVNLEASSAEEEIPDTPSFLIYPSAGKTWQYEIHSSKGLLKKGRLNLHDKIQTGWRDITVEVLQMFDHAEILRKIKKSESDTAGVFAVRLSQEHHGWSRDYWLTEDKPLSLETADGPLRLTLEPLKIRLPFELTLKDFRKKDYPGTASPASFESDVRLFDPARNLTLERTIRMNEPLDYAGWRIFQSSYIQDPQLGEASVFTIAKNPGIRLIYGGGVVILVGVLLLFYLHPFFNPSLRGTK